MTSHSRTHAKETPESSAVEQERYEIRLSGSGGQGLVLAGVILAQAIATIDHGNVVLTQSYGPEARGGASRADLVISSGDIYYPKPMKLDLLLALTQESCDTYFADLQENGLLMVDSHLVTQIPASHHVGFPFVQLARNDIGMPMVANMIALGAIGAVTKIVTENALREVVRQRAPRGTEEKNVAALELGLSLGKQVKTGAH
jgi:2-oxoglutarate ferredoxin oxidoreductase subunit gamma